MTQRIDGDNSFVAMLRREVEQAMQPSHQIIFADPTTRYMTASSAETDPSVLAVLAFDDDPLVAGAAAANPNIDDDTLDALLDRGPEIRAAVASNPKIEEPRVLDELAQDDNPAVRAAIAANPNTPPLVLERLARDEWQYVRQSVMSRANYGLLRAMDEPDSVQWRTCMASHPDAPDGVVVGFVFDEASQVREAALAELDRRGGRHLFVPDPATYMPR